MADTTLSPTKMFITNVCVNCIITCTAIFDNIDILNKSYLKMRRLWARRDCRGAARSGSSARPCPVPEVVYGSCRTARADCGAPSVTPPRGRPCWARRGRPHCCWRSPRMTRAWRSPRTPAGRRSHWRSTGWSWCWSLSSTACCTPPWWSRCAARLAYHQ